MFEHIHAEIVYCVHHLPDPELQRLCLQGGWFFLRGERTLPVVDVDIGDAFSPGEHDRVLHLITAPFERVVDISHSRCALKPFPLRRDDLEILVLQYADEIASELLDGLQRVLAYRQSLIDENLPVPEELEESMQPRQACRPQ